MQTDDANLYQFSNAGYAQQDLTTATPLQSTVNVQWQYWWPYTYPVYQPVYVQPFQISASCDHCYCRPAEPINDVHHRQCHKCFDAKAEFLIPALQGGSNAAEEREVEKGNRSKHQGDAKSGVSAKTRRRRGVASSGSRS